MPNHAKTQTLPDSNASGNLKKEIFPFRPVLLVCLAAVLFLYGLYSEKLFSFLTQSADTVFLYLKSYRFLAGNEMEVSRLITKRSFPAMVLYGAGYTLLSFLFLHVYFQDKKKSLALARFYGLVFIGCGLFMLIGKIFPELQVASRLSRRLIEFIVSPFPVVLLLAAFTAFPTIKKFEG